MSLRALVGIRVSLGRKPRGTMLREGSRSRPLRRCTSLACLAPHGLLGSAVDLILSAGGREGVLTLVRDSRSCRNPIGPVHASWEKSGIIRHLIDRVWLISCSLHLRWRGVRADERPSMNTRSLKHELRNFSRFPLHALSVLGVKHERVVDARAKALLAIPSYPRPLHPRAQR